MNPVRKLFWIIFFVMMGGWFIESGTTLGIIGGLGCIAGVLVTGFGNNAE